MKAYNIEFEKKDGSLREMNFVKLSDISDTFLSTKIKGGNTAPSYSEGSELVWDLEADAFRVVNYKKATREIKVFEIDDF